MSVSDLENENHINDFLRSLLAKNVKFKLTIDHRDTLLTSAKYYESKNDFDVAKLFLATYFEHSINSIIHTKCLQNNYPDKVKINLIKVPNF